MVSYQLPGATIEADASTGTAPLIVLFERDDTVAVPLLSQLRLASYDVRAARTPVELFSILSKQVTALVLVDLGCATAGRREFWIALDAHRRGRSTQVMTFRFVAQDSFFDADFEPSSRALADVEVHGAQEFQLIVEGVRQRIPLQGGGTASGPHFFAGPPASSYPGGIAPIGAALGVPSPFMYGGNGYGNGGFGGPPYVSAAPAQPLMPGAVPHYDPVGGYGPSYDQQFGAQAYNPYAASAPGYQPGYTLPGSPYSPPPPYPSAPYSPPSPYPSAPYSPPSPYPSAPYSPPSPYPSGPYSPPPPDSGPFPGAPQPGFMIPSGGPAVSPFAQPFVASPFPSGGEPSPFAQPYGANPFADVAGESSSAGPAQPGIGGGNGWEASAPGAAPLLRQPAPAEPWNPAASNAGSASLGQSPDDFWNDGNARAAAPQGPSFANGYAAAAIPGSGAFGASSAGLSPFGSDALRQQAREPEQQAAFSDVWTPPDGGIESGRAAALESALDGETGIVPEMAFKPVSTSLTETAPYSLPSSPEPAVHERPTSGYLYERPGSGNLYMMQPTAPVPAPSQLPAIRSETPTDLALGSVLVEGALLTPNKLEVLKGIQQMLSSVDMSFKLGELALLFKFLSPDQLLAALLVSRGLVSPQQIAGLGRVKQELAGSGMDYDLEALLLMFHILPPEQLQSLRAELD